MRLLHIVHRSSQPVPWREGDNIPWHEPGFSARMLKEHLSQEHDAASRRFETIDRQIHWIHHELLSGRPTRILDLGCGPGLYTSRLARQGHQCVGIDYSPASIAYAEQTASREHLRCRYVHQDIRTVDYGTGFGLVMLLYGEFNVFRPQHAQAILRKAQLALTGGGLLLLEPHTYAAVHTMGMQRPDWYSRESGLFSDRPHLCLQESFWDAAAQTATIRYWIIDATTGDVTPYAQSLQAYTFEEYHSVLTECGFEDIERFPSLIDEGVQTESSLFALAGRKRAVPPQP